MDGPVHNLVKVFKALSDPTRVRILKLLLEQKALCVCEIMQALDIAQARASRHLAILKEAGFLSDERDGLWVHYSVQKHYPNRYCERIVELLTGWIEEDPFVRRDKQRLKRAIKASGKP